MDKQIKDENVESRRDFLKKAAYVAPTIVALGSITKPVSSAAASATTYDPNNSGPSTTDSSDPANNDEGGFKNPF